MKSAVICRLLSRPLYACPNAITVREALRKLVDFLLLTAICAGVAACMVFVSVLL